MNISDLRNDLQVATQARRRLDGLHVEKQSAYILIKTTIAQQELDQLIVTLQEAIKAMEKQHGGSK